MRGMVASQKMRPPEIRAQISLILKSIVTICPPRARVSRYRGVSRIALAIAVSINEAIAPPCKMPAGCVNRGAPRHPQLRPPRPDFQDFHPHQIEKPHGLEKSDQLLPFLCDHFRRRVIGLCHGVFVARGAAWDRSLPTYQNSTRLGTTTAARGLDSVSRPRFIFGLTLASCRLWRHRGPRHSPRPQIVEPLIGLAQLVSLCIDANRNLWGPMPKSPRRRDASGLPPNARRARPTAVDIRNRECRSCESPGANHGPPLVRRLQSRSHRSKNHAEKMIAASSGSGGNA